MDLEVRTIGKTDLAVTTLGFGGGTIGGVRDSIDEKQVDAVFESAWEGGIRYFDTAPLYGEGVSERRLGARLSKLPREEFVLSSKVGRLLEPGGGVRYDYSYDGARRSLDASLGRLGLDHLDILFCHDIDVWTHGDRQPGIYKAASEGILRAMSELRRQGVVRAFGLGVNEAAVCCRVLEEFEVDCFLLAGRFTLLEQEPLDDLLPACVERQVSVIIGGPYNSGLLAARERRHATYDYKPVDDERWARAQRIREVCAAHGVDQRAAALQYPLHHPAVASVIPGVWREEEVTTNLALIRTELPSALWDDLDREGLARRLVTPV
jgi:D-threo-aldose 1-dehydrogenase